ncbi:ABC transporter permease subunit [Streptomyces lavenduligriseus]|uniref:ABC transporter permease subunit n=1 Tax=Streptomyces lavenduligriseus TaxID=67315 RepID=UPI00315860DB
MRSAARPAAAAGFPKELIEAASLDGAGRWTILWRIILPMSWPTGAQCARQTTAARGRRPRSGPCPPGRRR